MKNVMNFFTCAVWNPYENAVIILLVNGTLGVMPNEFSKQKGL